MRGVFLFNVCFAARVLFLLGVYFLLVLCECAHICISCVLSVCRLVC